MGESNSAALESQARAQFLKIISIAAKFSQLRQHRLDDLSRDINRVLVDSRPKFFRVFPQGTLTSISLQVKLIVAVTQLLNHLLLSRMAGSGEDQFESPKILLL